MLIKKTSPTNTSLTFGTPCDEKTGEPRAPFSFSMPLSACSIPREPRGKMTRKKRVRLRKKLNQLRRMAKRGKAVMVVSAYMHGTMVLKEEADK